MKISDALSVLSNSSDFLVLRKFEEVDSYDKNDGEETGTCLVVDVETTGLNVSKDKIVEFGAVLIEYGLDTGRVFRILERVSMLEDPGEPLPPEIVKLTHITDDEVKGKKFDDEKVANLLDKSGFVVAHNAGFDRKMLERRFPAFSEKPWGCSLNDVKWSEELEIGSGKLDYIAFKLGFFFAGAHRAVNDCAATVHVLAQKMFDKSIMSRLLESARKPSYVIWAVGSPFETKDVLKENGYRWNGGEDGRPKSWYKEIFGDDGLSVELTFLDKSVYAGKRLPEVEKADAFSRYSSRGGENFDVRKTLGQRLSPR